MEHNFNVKIAEKTNIECAVIFNNIYFWCKQNAKNTTNFYEGKYWTFASVKSLNEIFPYLTPMKIRYALKKLIATNLIAVGKFYEKCDRTLYYTVTDYALELIEGKTSSNNETKTEQIEAKNTDSTPNTTICSGTDKNTTMICYSYQNGLLNLTKRIVNFNNSYKDKNLKINLIEEKEIYKEKERQINEIYQLWNLNTNLIQTITLSEKTKQAIGHALQDFSVDEIKQAISRYSEILDRREYFFSQYWTIYEFMTKNNALPEFLDTGGKWLSYQRWLKNSLKNKENSFIHNTYTHEQIERLIVPLDQIEL